MRGRIILLCICALGLVFTIGCGGGGGEDVPRSSAAYAGSSTPAWLDSTTDTQYLSEGLLWDIGYFVGEMGGGRFVSLGSTT